MVYVTTKEEWEKLEKEVIDEETGETVADYIEQHYDEIKFV